MIKKSDLKTDFESVTQSVYESRWVGRILVVESAVGDWVGSKSESRSETTESVFWVRESFRPTLHITGYWYLKKNTVHKSELSTCKLEELELDFIIKFLTYASLTYKLQVDLDLWRTLMHTESKKTSKTSVVIV